MEKKFERTRSCYARSLPSSTKRAVISRSLSYEIRIISSSDEKQEAESSTIKLAFGDPELLELMIEWCYDNTVEYVTREDQLKCQCPTLCVRHGALYYAKLYIITGRLSSLTCTRLRLMRIDFYGIDTLKTKAAIELREWLADKDEYGNDDDIEASLSAARLIYTDTPDSDIDIRKAVSKKLATNLPRFQDHKALRKLIDETPALAMDLMKALVQK